MVRIIVGKEVFMKYIVLLRGINISGKNKIDMKTLKNRDRKSWIS